jgi:hypothetical protein
MFIIPFALEIRLASCRPTRAPVLGLSSIYPTSDWLTSLPRPIRAAGKRISLHVLPRSREPCEHSVRREETRWCIREAGRHTEGETDLGTFVCWSFQRVHDLAASAADVTHATYTAAKISKWIFRTWRNG